MISLLFLVSTMLKRLSLLSVFHYKFKISIRDINIHVFSLEIVSNFINYSAKLIKHRLFRRVRE